MSILFDWLLGFWPQIAAGLTILAGLIGWRIKIGRDVRRKVENKRIVAETKARKRGDDAVAKSKATGKTWQERLRDHKR